jgi:hypothetical protein
MANQFSSNSSEFSEGRKRRDERKRLLIESWESRQRAIDLHKRYCLSQIQEQRSLIPPLNDSVPDIHFKDYETAQNADSDPIATRFRRRLLQIIGTTEYDKSYDINMPYEKVSKNIRATIASNDLIAFTIIV